MNRASPVIPSQLTSSTLRSSQFQVIYITFATFLFLLNLWEVMNVYTHLSTSDGCFLLKRTRFTESFCCRSIELSKTRPKQRACFHIGESFLLLTQIILRLSLLSTFPILFQKQSYQLAEDLGRAFSDRAILQTFLDAEATVPTGSLKVIVLFLVSIRNIRHLNVT